MSVEFNGGIYDILGCGELLLASGNPDIYYHLPSISVRHAHLPNIFTSCRRCWLMLLKYDARKFSNDGASDGGDSTRTDGNFDY